MIMPLCCDGILRTFLQSAHTYTHIHAHAHTHIHTHGMQTLLGLAFSLLPGCGHCKKAKPEVADAAERLRASNHRSFDRQIHNTTTPSTTAAAAAFFLASFLPSSPSLTPSLTPSLSPSLMPSAVSVAAVDCTVEAALCQRFGVRAYPTIKHFARGDTTGQDFMVRQRRRGGEGMGEMGR